MLAHGFKISFAVRTGPQNMGFVLFALVLGFSAKVHYTVKTKIHSQIKTK